MIPGVDVSSFNGLPRDWQAAAGHITWAAVKITELQPDGNRYVNPDAGADWAYLRRQGLGRLAYCFGHPSTSATGTAAFLLGELEGLGLDDGDGAVLDLEVTDGLPAARVASWAGDVLATLHRELDRTPVLYTFISFADAGNCAGLGGYPLWLADPSSPAGRPRVPHPWKTWSIHQYAITGAIDRDVAAFADLAAFRHAFGRARKPKPDPRPPDPPTLLEDAMLLNRGQGAITPFTFPPSATKLRFGTAEGSASVSCEFVGVGFTGSMKLTFAGGSHTVDAPAGKNLAKLTRLDAGDNDVCVSAE